MEPKFKHPSHANNDIDYVRHHSDALAQKRYNGARGSGIVRKTFFGGSVSIHATHQLIQTRGTTRETLT